MKKIFWEKVGITHVTRKQQRFVGGLVSVHTKLYVTHTNVAAVWRGNLKENADRIAMIVSILIIKEMTLTLNRKITKFYKY